MTIAIIGAGLAGWAVAGALVDLGVMPWTIAVVGDPALGEASGVPGALLNPHTGRHLRHSPALAQAWEQAVAFVQRMPSALWAEREVVRVIGQDRRSEQLMAAFATAELAGGAPAPRWLESRELAAWMRPGPSMRGAIAYGGARAVRMAPLVGQLRARLVAAGVATVPWSVEALQRAAHQWLLMGPRGEGLSARDVVLACGAGLGRWFPGLDLRRVPGELLMLGDAPDCLAARHAPDPQWVLECGAHLMHVPGVGWTLGATYRPVQEAEGVSRSPEEVLAELAAELAPAMPGLDVCTVEASWRGVRCVHGSDGLPLAGPVPGQQGLHVLGALGSRGLFWAPALARGVAKNVVYPGDVGDLEFFGVHTGRVRSGRWILASGRELATRPHG